MTQHWINGFLQASWTGYVEFKILQRCISYPSRGPMNGQTARLEVCRRILKDFNITSIFESGTYRGTTTEWFAQFGIPTISIELNPRYASFSEARLRKYPHVRVVRGSSSNSLRSCIKQRDRSGGIGVYYLDAHWGEHLPLADELRAIRDEDPHAIVLIDDFQVIGDPGYEYDDYGSGNALTVDYLDRKGLANCSMFFPSIPAIEETGCRRGYIFLTADIELTASLERLDLLRRYYPQVSQR
jgi:predicted O-methyltransferase YrrM